MSVDPAQLKVKKDAAISALFSLNKASKDASYALIELIDYLESHNFDVSEMRSALNGERVTNGKVLNGGLGTPAISKSQEPVEGSLKHKNSAGSEKSGIYPNESETEVPKDTPATKEKKKRVPRDPNAPKRPLNAYLEFCNEDGKKVAEERKAKGLPTLARPEMSAIVKEHWDALSEDELQARLKKHQKEMEVYHSKLVAYKASIAESQTDADKLSSLQPQIESTAVVTEPASQQPPGQTLPTKQTISSHEAHDSPTPIKKKQKKSKEESKEKKKKSKSE